MTLTVLSLNDIQASIDMQQAIAIMESAFKEYHAQQAVLPLRIPVPVKSENALMLTMPAYLSEQKALGLKVVSVFPNNNTINKPAINGVMLVLNEKTGEAQAIMEAGYLTALRTGAVSGLATKYLAKEDASHLTLIGSGVQALTQLEAVACVRPITQVSVWSRNIENSQRFAKKIADKYEVQCFSSIKEAVKNADIICTATGSLEPLIQLNDLQEQVHINAVGSHSPKMCEISNEVMANALIVVDQLEAALAESGEVIAALQADCIKQQDIIELGSLINQLPNSHHHSKTLFKSVGLAIQDISIAHAVYSNAVKKGLGQPFELL